MIENTEITDLCTDSKWWSTYTPIQKPTREGIQKKKVTTPQPWVKHFCGCNSTLPQIAKSKALTPKNIHRLRWSTQQLLGQHVFKKYAMLGIKPPGKYLFYAPDHHDCIRKHQYFCLDELLLLIYVWQWNLNLVGSEYKVIGAEGLSVEAGTLPWEYNKTIAKSVQNLVT